MKTIDRGRFYTTEDLGAKRSVTPEGFLVCQDVPIARTGVQLYLQDEMKDEDGNVMVEGGPDGLVRVERLPEQVFRPETIASFEGKAVTVEHPEDFVNPSNWQQLAIGTVQNVRRGEGLQDDLLIADLVITDQGAIAYVNKSLPEVSAGYDAHYEQTEPGRGVQRDIVGNHVALVERGRAGPRCSIQDQEPKMTKKTVKRSFADRLRAAFMSKDAEAAEELAKEAEDEEGDETDEDKDKKGKTADALSQIMTKLKSMDEDIQELKKAKTGDEETEEERKAREAKENKTTDTVLEAEEAGKADIGKVLSGDSLQAVVARAEILSPGASLKTKDGKAAVADVETHMRDALTKARTTDAGKAAVDPFLAGRDLAKLTGDSLQTVFTGAAELARAQNNRSGARTSAATRDFGRVSSVADINAKNRDFWAKRNSH